MTALVAIILLLTMTPVEKVVAVVDDNPILHSEVEELLIESGYPLAGSYPVDSQTPEYFDALKQLVEEKLLVIGAIDEGYYPNDAEILILFDEVMESENPFGEYPENSDVAMEYRKYLSSILGDRKAAQDFIGSKVREAFWEMTLSPEVFLSSNPDMVNDIVMPRHIGWIYLPVLPSGDDLDLAIEETEQIRDQILAGESFAELAAQWSDDGSAMNGGSLGAFGPGEMTPVFEGTAFSLETDEISHPVVTPFGVHIIKLDKKNDDGTIEASHILRMVSIDQADIDLTLIMADALLDSIRAVGGITFEQAARQYSLDRSSSENGGDLGTVPLNMWLPAIAEAASLLEMGAVSEPVILPEAGAVILLKLYDDSDIVDWSTYTEAELNGIVQQVIYQKTYNTLIDSLRNEIPVIYYLETAENSAN